ncbi:phage holin family protein [Williamsia sp. M5A3_1d]
MTGAHGADFAPGTAPTTAQPSIGELLSDVTQDLSLLMRQELELAKAEASQTVSRVGKGSGMLAGAAVAGYFVLLFLSVALWWSIGNATGHGWSALIVTAVWAVIGAVLALLGRAALHTARGLPRTTETVKNIPPAVTPHPRSAS